MKQLKKQKKMSQTTNTLLLIKPAAFNHNTQTAINNHFQKKSKALAKTIQEKALKEFETLVK